MRCECLRLSVALLLLLPPVALLGAASPTPPAAQFDVALESAADVALARAQLEDAQASGRIETSSPSGWLARGSTQSRDVTGERDFREWDLSLEHSVRLPGKRGLDRSVAELELERAQAAFADIRRSAAIQLLDAWFRCVAAAARTGRAAEELRVVADLEESVIRQHVAGDASQMDVNLATAERAALEANAAGATEELRGAKAQLQARGLNAACEGLALTDPPPAAPATLHDPGTDPAVRAAAAAAELARVRATRARADRWSDPSIGVRYAEERGGAERILGVFISMPLPGRRLAAESDRAAARAHLAEAEHRQAELQSALRSGESRARLRAASSQWGPLNEASKLQSQAARQAWTAYTLGESDLATALVAMRFARTAQANVQACAVEAWHASSLLRALLESE